MKLEENELGSLWLFSPKEKENDENDEKFKEIKIKTSTIYFKLLKIHTNSKEDHLTIYKILKMIYRKMDNKNVKFVQIYDARSLEISFSLKCMAYCKSFASFLKSQAPVIEKNCYATAVILENKKAARFLNTFLTIYQNKRPIKIVKDFKEASEWLNIKIDENNFTFCEIQDLGLK